MPRLDVDFSSRAMIADPFATYRRLIEDDPAHYNPRLGAWCLTRYDDVTAAFRDERFGSDRIRPFVESRRGRTDEAAVRALGDILALWMVFNDPPMHTRLRRLMSTAFLPKVMHALVPDVRRYVGELLGRLPRAGEVDFIEAFAYPLPALVISHVLGVPRADVAALKRWSDDVAAFVLVSRLHATKYDVAARSLAEMAAYFEALIARRRADPGDKLIDALISAHEDDDALTLPELVSAAVLLLFAGHETTTHFLGNGLWALVRHPNALAEVRASIDDDDALQRALHEMLRWDGPSISQVRVLKEDVELHGETLRARDRVVLFTAAANRDPRAFHDPDRFDVARADAGKHLAFGYGIHYCIGAHLAKLEAAETLRALLPRLRRAELIEPEPAWSDSFVVRGLLRLPLRLELD